MPSSASSLTSHPPPAMPTSPRQSYSGPTPARPSLMKRHSSQSSHSSRGVASPASFTEHPPTRHHIKPRHAKVVLPRNHSSARNLAKLGRQPPPNGPTNSNDDGRRHSRQRSHEGDTEIRLPGSLEDSRPVMRRNLTASQLPRNTSHVKLKKNLSHGQLTRLSSGRNLNSVLSHHPKGPPSPALKGRSAHRSQHAELVDLDHDVQVQGKRKDSSKKVGFAVGSADDSSDAEEAPDMEGSGLQEDEWTDQSASASPYSTRQNTANNSRRASVIGERDNSKLLAATEPGAASPLRVQTSATPAEEQVESASTESNEPDSPAPQEAKLPAGTSVRDHAKAAKPTPEAKATMKSPLHQAKLHTNPMTRRLLDPSHQHPAPALLSNVSALTDGHSAQITPVQSMKSSRSTLDESPGDVEQDELVSRFVPSTSHPSSGSGGNTTANTPKQNSYSSPEEQSHLASRPQHKTNTAFQVGTVSPGSTMSGSSGATTPALGRSRTELRMLHEKALADMESAAELQPVLPPHIYDRRNESLKSHLDLVNEGVGRSTSTSASDLAQTTLRIGPELFQGRFRAVNTELRVVQKFRDPLAESVARLTTCRSSVLGSKRLQQQQQHAHRPHAAGLVSSRSAVNLPHRQLSNLARSSSPPKAPGPLKRATQSSVQIRSVINNHHRKNNSTSNTAAGASAGSSSGGAGSGGPNSLSATGASTSSSGGAVSAGGMSTGGERHRTRREVSFAHAPPETREFEPREEEMAAEVIARRMWEG